MSKLVIGKTIKMPAMRRGLCWYPNDNETVLLQQDVLKAMAETSYGIPVVVYHKIVDSTNVDKVVVGRVADMHYDAGTDNWEAHFVCDDSDAVAKLQSGWGVSTAYTITRSGPGGTHNNVPFQREVLGARYEHLAIVDDPRYEMARNPTFYNSKTPLNDGASGDTIDHSKTNNEGKPMIGKFWRKILQETKLNSGDEAYVKIGDKEMKLNDVLAELHAAEVKENSKVSLNGDDQVEYNGHTMTVNDVVARYNAMVEKKNTEEANLEGKKINTEEANLDGKKINAEDEAKEKKEKEDKENAEKEKADKENADKEAAEKAKENAKEKENFDALKEIKENGDAAPSPVEAWQSMEMQLANGKKLFGSGK